jgi:hypothetical protein
MSANVQRSSQQPSRRRLLVQLLCMMIVAGVLAYAAPVASGAEEPQLPSVGGGGNENLSIGIYWGLYEQPESEMPDKIGIVGAPMPFLMELKDNGEHRLFTFIQHRLPGGPYCAETPAQLEDISVDLTAAAGDATIPGPEYSKTYVWTPTEPGEYTLCAYLDAAAADHPVEINFVKLAADPAPGELSLAVTPEAGDPKRMTVKAEGEAVVPSKVTASVQEQGLSCTLPEGRLAGQQLPELPGSANAGSGSGTVGPGPFTASYTFAAEKPGPYEVCAYLTPAPTEKMHFGRPYEVGSADFSVQETSVEPASAQQAFTVPAPEVPPPPKLSGVRTSNSHFRMVRGRARAIKHTAVGTTFRFSLSETATVTIGITRLLPDGRICEPLRAAAVGTPARRCDRSVAVGSIVRQLTAGGDAIPFSGVIGHRELVAGSYSATVTAHNANGRSRSVTLRFSVAP